MFWQIGASGAIPPYSFVVHNPVSILGYEAETAPIGNGDANPIAIIYDVLTNEWGGIGAPASAIDLTSFAAAAQTLQDEQHGMSLVVQRAVDARELIETVLKQIDGVVYEEPTTRKYVVKLVREDYTLGSLFIADESNIIGAPELSTTLWEKPPTRWRSRTPGQR